MAVVSPFWVRPGVQVPYPGLRQTGDTCVFVSIAAAVNWLTGSNLTEDELILTFSAMGMGPQNLNFANVLKLVLPHHPDVEAIEYHDQDNPLPNVSDLLDRVRAGGVLVLSLEVANPTGDVVHRHGQQWHMISVFNSADSDAQVWDSNGYAGFLRWEEVGEFLTGGSIALPKSEQRLSCSAR